MKPAVGVAAILLLAGCAQKRAKPDPASLEIGEARTIRVGPVGLGEAEARATYALLDVRNPNDRPVVAELVGTWIDGAGNPLGPTRSELLTVPAGGVRMFALVDANRREVDNAVKIEARIKGASYGDASPRLVITNENQFTDQGRAVIAGFVENRGEGAVTAMVVAAFYDADGVPLEREASPYHIDGRLRRGIQHVGPPGSARGVLFVADYD